MKTLAPTLLVSLGVCLCHAQPANDMFANALPLTGTGIVVTGSNVGATNTGDACPPGCAWFFEASSSQSRGNPWSP